MHNCCFIRRDGKYIRLPFSQIRFIEARKNYPRIYLGEDSFVALLTLKQLEQHLPEEIFCRIHRSYIISLEYITAFDTRWVYVGGKTLPLARHYQKAFHQKLLILDSERFIPGQPVPFTIELTTLKGGLN